MMTMTSGRTNELADNVLRLMCPIQMSYKHFKFPLDNTSLSHLTNSFTSEEPGSTNNQKLQEIFCGSPLAVNVNPFRVKQFCKMKVNIFLLKAGNTTKFAIHASFGSLLNVSHDMGKVTDEKCLDNYGNLTQKQINTYTYVYRD